MTHIGKLRQKIILQKPQYQSDQQGGTQISWKNVDQIWAKIQNHAGHERELKQGEQTTHFYKITIRARNDITPDMRFIYKNNIFNILHIYDPDGYQKWTICRCRHVWREENI